MMSFNANPHAAIGAQLTLNPTTAGDAPTLARLAALESMAASEVIGLTVKGVIAGEARGGFLSAGTSYQMDRTAEQLESATLRAGVAAGSELTYTAVPFDSRQRIGVDRDEDGLFDRDELDGGGDPADPNS